MSVGVECGVWSVEYDSAVSGEPPSDNEDGAGKPGTSKSAHTCLLDHTLLECSRVANDLLARNIQRQEEEEDDLPGLMVPSNSDDSDVDYRQKELEEEEDNDLPDLLPQSDSDNSDDGYRQEELYAFLQEENYSPFDESSYDMYASEEEAEHGYSKDFSLALQQNDVLTSSQPFPGDRQAVDPTYVEGEY
jgi:hypothetical protein